jgi:hypothetical protein
VPNNTHQALYDLLIESCRHTPDVGLLEKYTACIDDWKGFLDSAYSHGIFPLVHKSLKSIITVPDNIKLYLKSTNFEIARRNMTMMAELLKIMKLLEENGIPALAIKGPVLSQMIYGDVTQRQYADLDILVSENDLYTTTKLLLEHEYQYDHPIQFTKNKALLRATKDITLSKSSSGIELEMHWRLFSGRLFKKSNINLFRDSVHEISLNQQKISTLDDNVLVLYLLLHGSKHMWERLEWIVDIDRLVRSREIDWEVLEHTAMIMDIKPLIHLGCAVCYDLFRTPFPDNLIETFMNDTAIHKAKNIVVNDLYLNKIFDEGRIMNTVYYLGIGKINQSWYEYLIRFIRYTKSDVYTINLPNWASFLYHLIHLYHSASYRIKLYFSNGKNV